MAKNSNSRQTPKSSFKRTRGTVTKASKLSKSKLKHTSKQTSAEINKLNLDLANVQSLHSTLTTARQTPKRVNALDSKSLQEGLKKDNEVREKNFRAERDLAAQLELLTGMEL